MTSEVDIANRALSGMGDRTVSQIASFSERSAQAKQINLHYAPARDELLRMAPWNCATNYDNLALLKSAPGTPENPSQVLTAWNKTVPAPPWAYEYALPSDSLRALWIIPQFSSGLPGGVPISPISVGWMPSYWNGPAVRFKVAIDQDSFGNDIEVLLTNQPQAILCYIKRVTNPNVWDPQFQQAFVALLSSRIVLGLSGDKQLANLKLNEANSFIQIARAGDGNEGLTVIDSTPDWIRVRGIVDVDQWNTPSMQFDWGPLFPSY